MAEMTRKSYTPKEVAQVLGVSVYTVHELLREGRLTGFKITSQWRVAEEDLQRFIEEGKSNTKKEEEE